LFKDASRWGLGGHLSAWSPTPKLLDYPPHLFLLDVYCILNNSIQCMQWSVVEKVMDNLVPLWMPYVPWIDFCPGRH